MVCDSKSSCEPEEADESVKQNVFNNQTVRFSCPRTFYSGNIMVVFALSVCVFVARTINIGFNL